MTSKEQIALWKQEIMETEKKFSELANSEGIEKAFIAYADDNAVLLRGDKLIEGKQAIQSHFKQLHGKNIQLSWSPNFVEVAKSGDLAYTYGNYSYTVIDSTGIKTESEGIFHTVWKRQSNGQWKFVWD